MNIRFEKHGVLIDNFNEWKKLGHPKSDDQWVEGRSSFEMARFAIEHTDAFKKMIEDVLAECNIETQDFISEPESTSGLGKGMKRGGSRNHDLRMIGKNCVIGVEAKVSESFDKKFKDVIDEQTKEDPHNTRAYCLSRFLAPDKDVDERGYQLFTATRGIMCDAYRLQYSKSILLVIVFTGNVRKEKKYESNCLSNDVDFDEFKKAIETDTNDLIQRKIDGRTITCWIKKIKVQIPEYSFY